LLSRRQKDVMSPRLGTAELRRSTKELSSPPMSRKLMLTLFVISGFLSFGYELFWTRSLITILGNSTYAISSMLMVTLLGLVVGGGIMTRIVDRIRRPLMVLGAMEAGIGVTSLVALPILIGSLYTEGVQAFFFAERGGWAGSIILRFGAASTALLVPSILNGAALPLMLRTVTRTMASRGRDIGLAYAADAGGNVLGVLVPAFVVLPILGVSRGLLVLGLANLALGFVYLVPRQGRWLAFPVAATLLTLAAVVPINFQFPSDTHVGSDPILFYEEGVEATTRVYRKQDTGDYHMSVDGVFIGGSGDAARKEIVLAHLPTSICPGARSVLTVGLGSGVLAAELASYEHLRKISVVEIAPSVARGAEAVPDWAAVYPEDPRVDLRIDDVMNYLLASDERYDIVISDGKSRPTARGNGLFFSADYYEALRSSLAEEGVVFQWLSLHLAGEDFRTILRTFSASFKHVALWWLPDTDAFLIGSDAPFSIPASGHAFPPGRLLDYGITSSAATADLVVTTGDDLRGLAGPGNVSTLDRPVIEFFSIRDYASPASSMIAANLELLAYATAENEELEDLLTLLADAYSGNANRADTDDRALALRASSPPIAAAISRYFVARASGRLRSDDPAAALEYAQRSLEALPDSLVQAGLGADAFYYRGLALVALGDQQGAVEALVAAVEARPHRPAFRVALARSLVAAGDTTGAIKQYEAILSIMPENVPALQSVGVATAARGRPADALRLLEKAHTLEPETPAVIDSYAWVLHLNGRTEAARRVVQRGGAYASGRPDFENRRRIILEGEDAR
ncbi:MAG TPA: fused MFS/spermidine synthase, partial [Spirochaetia bacterium]|nr:fused MFS/spermidine synthase [Spirochaetia bacterium]